MIGSNLHRVSEDKNIKDKSFQSNINSSVLKCNVLEDIKDEYSEEK